MGKNLRNVAHPLGTDNPDGWFMGHPAMGFVAYKDLDRPTDINSVELPKAWLNMDEVEQDDMIRKWAVKFLEWVDSQSVVYAYFEGGYSKKERLILDPYGVPFDGTFNWTKELIQILPTVGIDNIWLKTADSYEIMSTEGWDNLFINTLSGMPSSLTKPILNNE